LRPGTGGSLLLVASAARDLGGIRGLPSQDVGWSLETTWTQVVSAVDLAAWVRIRCSICRFWGFGHSLSAAESLELRLIVETESVLSDFCPFVHVIVSSLSLLLQNKEKPVLSPYSVCRYSYVR
jgi:hypothetical protein